MEAVTMYAEEGRGSEEARQSGERRERRRRALSIAGAASAAITASLCCIAPMVILAFGLGATWFVEAIEPWRPVLILFELAGYLAYKKFAPPAQCDVDGFCATDRGKVVEQVVFWSVATAMVVTIVVVAS